MSTVPNSSARRTRSGFTLVELCAVIVILAILIALLLPAINSAVRTAKNAAVQAEINQLAAALENFRAKYGDYPPSRVILVENGDYSTLINSTLPMMTLDSSSGSPDVTVGQVTSRTVAAFRKFWPKVQLATGGNPLPNISANYYYDFNGNGRLDSTPYILRGHECLVFFLGGVVYLDPATSNYVATGFGSDPANPFSNSISATPTTPANSMYSPNRSSPLFEFSPSRLYLDPSNASNPQIPGYFDTLGGNAPTRLDAPGMPRNYIVYFSAYGNGGYDPNDSNISEVDASSFGPIELQFNTSFPPGSVTSAGPNPYTASATSGPNTGTVIWQNPNTYQLISAGADGLYGVGGQYVQSAGSAQPKLPFAPASTFNAGAAASESDPTIRQREGDNLTNFKSGTLD